MKISKRLFAIVTVTLIGLVVLFVKSNSEAENCCNGGRCTGSAYCNVCSNCSRCAHCKGGGTCGVCSSSTTIYKTPKSTYKASKPVYHHSEKTNSPLTKSNVTHSKVYTVNATTLNVRSEPSTTSSIIYTLKYGDVVTVLKTVDEKWYKIQVNNNIIGYVI